MKIGEFADKFGISIDTVRYYMELGLLMPIKNKHFYCFDEQCERDMAFILEYKSFSFSVNEILKLLALKRIAHSLDDRVHQFMDSHLLEKRKLIEKEIDDLKDLVEKIEEKRHQYRETDIAKKADSENLHGIPVSFISFIRCPLCQSNLSLSQVKIDGEHVINGLMTCECSYKADIRKGIIYGPDRVDSTIMSQSTELYSGADLNLLSDADYEYFILCYNCYRWMDPKVFSAFSENKDDENLILTSGAACGRYFFYYLMQNSQLDQVFRKATLFLCMPSETVMKNFLSIIQHFKRDYLNVVFFVGDPEKIPIKNKSVNLLIDDFSSTSYANRTQKDMFIMDICRKYLAKQAQVIGFIPDKLMNRVTSTGEGRKFMETEFSIDGFKTIESKIINPPSRNKSFKNHYKSYYAYHIVKE